MRVLIGLLLILVCIMSAGAYPVTSDEFDEIVVGGAQRYFPSPNQRVDAIADLQVLMDRFGFSPGVIDGLDTNRYRRSLETFNNAFDLNLSPDDPSRTRELLEQSGGPALTEYEIQVEDLNYGFTPEIPPLYVEQASMGRINFKSVQEMLAERFHMDETYLRELNAGREFHKAGTLISIAAIGRDLQKPVAWIEADKSSLLLKAFDSSGSLVAAYPASIGSASTPSPNGKHRVRNKAKDPAYTYDPQGSAQPGQTKGLLLLPPGPNGPVGNAWIGLSKKTYGIHGTPEPSLIGIAQSVGCIRLTNWDALELARLVKKGIEVVFVE